MTYGSSKITVKITCIYIAIYIYTVTTIKLYVLDNPILFTVYNILNKRLYNLFYILKHKLSRSHSRNIYNEKYFQIVCFISVIQSGYHISKIYSRFRTVYLITFL